VVHQIGLVVLAEVLLVEVQHGRPAGTSMTSGVDAGKEREPAVGDADAGAGGGESSVGVF